MRPATLNPLFAQPSALAGIGPQMAKKLENLRIAHVRDLLWHLPFGMVDRRHSPPLPQAANHEVISTVVTVIEHKPPRNRRMPYQVWCENETGALMLTFFHAKGDYLLRALPIGEKRLVSGRVERYHGILQMPHPDYIVTPEEAVKVMVAEPVYPLTAGISNKLMRGFVERALEKIPALPEWGEPAFLKQQGWPDWKQAIATLHAPLADGQETQRAQARARLAYDEVLANQLALAIVRRTIRAKPGPVLALKALPRHGEAMLRMDDGGGLGGGEASGRKNLLTAFRTALPFTLTPGQQDVCREIAADLASGNRMLRLLQGDVGSGKTVVALEAMLTAVACGKQAALMAPTEIVSRQHCRWVENICAPLGVRVGFLSGSLKGKARKQLLEALAAGEVDILIGTHALFQEHVTFRDLALVVVDEQHRFGVNQRLALAEKAGQAGAHMLLMSATPIPRTLTMTAFGDMETSRLTDKPAGRKPVDTRVMPLAKYDEVVEGVRRATAKGERVYWVCPLVEESETLDVTAVESRFTEFKQRFGDRVGLVHGRMKAEERQATVERFAAGGIDILIATTVIEVGVDVPQATIMVIEHAERFGLAQLHQLRGRVGRGDKPSHCLLLYDDKLSEAGRERLKIMRASEDGFFIAEEDLRLRGGGEVLGTRQSGLPEFHFADLYEHREIIYAARDDVKLILNKDPTLQTPRGQALRTLLYLFEYDRMIGYLGAG